MKERKTVWVVLAHSSDQFTGEATGVEVVGVFENESTARAGTHSRQSMRDNVDFTVEEVEVEE